MSGGVWMLRFGGGEEVRASKRACAEGRNLVPNARAGIVTAVFFSYLSERPVYFSRGRPEREARGT